MQLKHNNPMEKRTDLPSLFCMIGRHGPAVAVAVIAVVSVVAGFIIYRTVKGKRRKAEAGPGAGDVSGGSSSSQGAPRDAVQPEKEPSPEHEASSRVESTDVCKEVSNAGDGAVIRSRRKLKNRRATAKESPRSSSPLKEVKPEKLQNASKVEDASGVTQTDVEETMKSLQDGTCEVGNLNVEDEGYKHNLVERPNDAEGKHNGSLEPVVVSENLANEEKVQRSQKEEVTVEDVSTEIPCKDEENLCALNSPICLEENASVSSNGNYKLNRATSDSIKPEGYFEEPAVHMDESISTKNEDEISVLGIAGLNKPHPASEDSQNVALQKHISNQHMTSPAIDCATSKQSPNSDATENNLVELSANCAVLLSSKELKLEQDSSTCSKNAEDVKMASFSESQETAVVLSHVPSCLSVEPETINHEYQALPLIGLLPEDKIKDDVTSELAKATIDALCGLACPQGEVDETTNGILFSKENVEILSSPDAAVGDVGSAASLSSRPDDNVLSSFQDQEGEQMQNADLEVPSDPAPVMAETVEPQPEEVKPIYENPWKLSWYDFGVESGISSMAVSPDLPDVESPLISEVLLPVTVPLPSEGQAELQTTMAESCAVIKEPTDAIPESSNDSQPHIKNTDEANDDSCTVSETCCEIESFNTTVGKLAKDATTDFCLNVDLGNMGTKIVIEGKREVEGKEEDKTTEINIMEATMDNNEWITDGTDQVLPWMKPPSSQINPVSIENVQVSSSVDVTCTHADVPPVNECEEDNTVPLSDEATEPGKRVLAVQPMPQNVSVTFQIHYLTHSPYQKVAIAGNHFELGNWKDFVPLEKVKDGFWATVVSLPAESHVEWKFVIVERGEVCRWEECGNRLLDTGNRETLLVHKCWGFL